MLTETVSATTGKTVQTLEPAVTCPTPMATAFATNASQDLPTLTETVSATTGVPETAETGVPAAEDFANNIQNGDFICGVSKRRISPSSGILTPSGEFAWCI